MAVTEVHILAHGWDSARSSSLNLLSSFLAPIKPPVYLRPDDELEIGKVKIKIQQGTVGSPVQAGEIQVKSSGQIGMDSGNDDHTNKTESFDSAFAAIHRLSTPNLQLAHNPKTTETVMETPAATSRYHAPSLNPSSTSSSIAGNLVEENEEIQHSSSYQNGRQRKPRAGSRARHCKALLSGGSVISKNVKENGISIEANDNTRASHTESLEAPSTPLKSDEMCNHVSSDIQKKSHISPKIVDDESQTSIQNHGEYLLNAAVESQERPLRSPPSDLNAEPSVDDRHASEPVSTLCHDETSLLKTPNHVPESSDCVKRKRPNDESQESIRSIAYVEVPLTTPAPAVTYSSKRQKSSVKGTLTKRQKASSTVQSDLSPTVRTSSSKQQIIESSRASVDPSSSNMSTRSSSTSLGARILYASSTSVDKSSKLMGFLEKNKIKKAKTVADCDILCVGNGELKKTSNLVMAAICGKQIITDEWVVQSAAAGELLDLDEYLARDATREAEWGISLDQAIRRGKDGAKPLAGLTFQFTPAVKKELGKSFLELKDIALRAGAKAVQATLPKKSAQAWPSSTSPIIIIAAPHDRDLATLKEGGWKTYSKDILTLSVLRGHLDQESDEFLIQSEGPRKTSTDR